MSKKILGLDIRQDAVAAVLVKSGIKGNWIESYARVPTDQKEIETSLPAALETITRQIDTAGSLCVASFPGDQVCYRNIQIPFRDQKKIRQVLPFELEPTLPFPIEDVTTDFHIINLPDSKDHTNIITATVEKTKLKLYLNTLVSLKMEPEIVTVGGYATALCLAKFANIPEDCLFMDIDTDKCSVFVIISGQIYLIRSFPINSNAGRTESLCIEVQRTLAAFEEIFPLNLNYQPNEIHIAGYGTDTDFTSGFEPEAERILGIPVRRADIVKDTGTIIRMRSSASSPEMNWEQEQKASGQMDNAYALALLETEGLNSLNFRRGEFAPKKQWAEHKSSIIKTGILASLMLILLFCNMMTDSYSLEKKVAELDRQIINIFKTTFPDVKRIIDPLSQMQVAIQEVKKTAALPGGTENIRTTDILNEISKRIPQETDVEFKRLVIGENNILISGDTDTYNAVDDIKNKLEQADIFKEVTITSSTIAKGGNRVRFKLKVDL
ncbi:type II secretion system protein GspL [Desulfonema magnum]|uniref:Pilus assembly protein domain-containing protein n=1 Tax=Desulfonema magnum TaxID=45655 RepID=A0A975BWU8_9BACT|nr:type II secretion system protein GspL [Desulfonema magnum]QTA93226.1 Pilus assembly protein domain-containing protein [Desulfonema magnum]